ncbi:carbon-nitrogen hydrolase family protein [Bacillaceae bacterium SAOS 7]|nr:carbon-nitrogen hydrolase family protein [Bacillaceae bacterium SAOS 7]
MNKIRLCLAQVGAQLNSIHLNMKRVLHSIEHANKVSADYVIFPEMYLTGVCNEQNPSIKLFLEISAEEIKVIQSKARENHVGVILGFLEKENNHFYNSAVVIDKKGVIKGKYQKIHLSGLERNIFSSGSSCNVIRLPEATIGLMISYDIEFPEIARILATNGAQIIITLSAKKYLNHHFRDIYLTSRAMENHVFISCVNLVGLNNQTVYLGESIVIEPSGDLLYRGSNNEELPVIELDLSKIKKAGSALDYMKNRRPKIYEKENIYQL